MFDLPYNTIRSRRYLNACDWHDCESCPHEDCIADIEKSLDRRKRKYKKNYAYKKAKQEKGFCFNCGKPVSSLSKWFCDDCRTKINKKRRGKQQQYLKHPKNPKLCWLCNKLPPIEDKKLCLSCYMKQSKILAKARLIQQKKREKNARTFGKN